MHLPLTVEHKAWYPQAVETLAAWVLQPEQAPAAAAAWPVAAWEAFGIAAYLHGVLPLLWAMPWRTQLPLSVQETVAVGYRANAQRNERLLGDLARVLTALAAADIPVMPLKGSLLLESNVYGDAALRALHDLDLLVPAEHLTPATQVLLTIGYRVENRTWRHVVLHPPGAATIVSWTQDHPDNPRYLDLHSHVREEFRGASYDLTPLLWEQAQPRSFLGATAWAPASSALLHHLTLHASISLLERVLRLVHLVDLVMLTQGRPAGPTADALTPLSADGARFLYPALGLLAHYQPHSSLTPLTARLAGQVHAPLRAWLHASRLSNRTFGIELTTRPGEMLRVWPRTRREQLLAAQRTIFHSRSELAALYPRLSASPFFWLAQFRFWGRLVASWTGRSWRSLWMPGGSHDA